MKITINESKSNRNPLIREFCHWAIKKLDPNKNHVGCNLKIALIPNLLISEGIHGDCDRVAGEDDDSLPTKFEIRADAYLGIEDLLRTIAHELVHVKQYMLGEMYEDLFGAITVFNGKSYSNSNSDDDNYWDSPWEIEAYGREEGLYRRFIIEKKLKDASWVKLRKLSDYGEHNV
jgi:hypothetical protein